MIKLFRKSFIVEYKIKFELHKLQIGIIKPQLRIIKNCR